MGWGTSAGLVEQLSYALRRPVDRLAQNDDAAFATRAMLARDPGRLEGKRVVIYQFAARELASGDWAILP
jgi:alginate O-acetyltransferase complex protein AlgJ